MSSAASSGDGVGVPPEALDRHAHAVDAVADLLTTARAAGAQVRLDRQAYGKLPPGQMIAALIDPIQRVGVDTLAAAVDALHSTAEALRVAGRGYVSTDSSVYQTFDGGGSR